METEVETDIFVDTGEFDASCDRLAEILRHLNSQGGKAEIAAYLMEAGIRGTPGRSSECPVAVWLALQSSVDIVSVGVHYMLTKFTDLDVVGQARTPANVAEFIRAFDQGEFAELRGVLQ